MPGSVVGTAGMRRLPGRSRHPGTVRTERDGLCRPGPDAMDAPPDDIDAEVLFFGTFDETLHPRVRVLREGLAAHGATVQVLNRPLDVGTAQRVEMLRRPLRLLRFVAAVLRRWVGLVLAARRLPSTPDVVVVGYLGHLDVHLARMLFRRSTIVLDHLVGLYDTAKDRRLLGRVDPFLERIDRWALGTADIVVFDTDEQLGHLGGEPDGSVVVPVGAPEAFFVDGRPDHADGEALRVLFFGLFTPLQGAETIGDAIRRLAGEPGIRFTIVGKGQDHAAAAAAAAVNPHIDWIDWITPEQLPAVVASHDVCLGIFGTTPKALRVVPNKVYQGLAAGTVVVTSDTAAQRRVLGDAAVYVPPGDPGQLAKALELLAERPELRAELRCRARERAEADFTPAAVVRPLIARLRRDLPSRRP